MPLPAFRFLPRTRVPLLAAALAVGLAAVPLYSQAPATSQAHSAGNRAAPGALTTAEIPNHTNIVKALSELGLDRSSIAAIVAAARPVFNLAHIQAGHTILLRRNGAGAPQSLSYEIAPNQNLRVEAASGGGWSATVETTPYETRTVGVSGTVQSSLFGAVEAAGESDALALQLANIFGWDLDFYTDPRAGDVFRVLVEKRYLNGKFSGYGQIVAAEYVNAGVAFDALRFHDELGELAYYKPDGRPMKRAFLRSPLKFAAPITSGFSEHRFHPILKVYRAHLGTDFGAPSGTPVQTIGSGVVVRAGNFGGDGNMVQIEHSGGYQTLYLHLSRILVRRGERVAQGQRIGLVGMTGLATGPHLDFRIEHNGVFENFEILRKKLPPADPVGPALRGQFAQLRSHYMPELTKLEPHAAAAASTGAVK